MSENQIGHNSNVDGDELPGELTESQFWDAIRMQQAFEEEKKGLSKRLSAFRQDLKSRGVTLGVFDAVMKLTQQEDETVVNHLQERFKYMRWAKLPFGSQSDLFPPDEEEERLKPDAFNAGFKVGAVGGQRKPPDEYSIEDGQVWMNGYDDGQKHLAYSSFSDSYKAGVDPDDTSAVAEAVTEDQKPKKKRGRPATPKKTKEDEVTVQ